MVTLRTYVGSLLLGFILCVLPAPGQNVVLVVIDGVRYSESFGGRGAHIPHLWNDLRPLGTIWLDYRNEGVTSTIPGHTSIETGTWQTIRNDGSERATRPTIFEYFRKHTGAPESLACLVVRKEKLLSLSYGADEEYGEAYGARAYAEESDTAVLARVKGVLANEKPRLLLINFGETDLNAHAGNWEGYIGALRTADSLTFSLWNALQASAIYRNNTVLIVTNDHGRHDDNHGGFQHHGDDCEGCRHIMLLAAGGRFSRGYASNTRVTQIDLAGTVGGILGFPARYSIGGSVLGDTLKDRRSKEVGGSTIPSRLRVLPAYPNPFNPTSRIEYGIPRRERVVIKIFDTAGREVLTTLDAEQSGGYHAAIVDGSGLSSGAYFFRVRSGTEQAAGRLVLTR